MALVASAMQATMLARAVSQGLVDQPPHFALSRVYGVIARGVVETILSHEFVATVFYTGQPAVTFGTAIDTGLDGLDADRFANLCLAASAFSGPFSVPFFHGIGGVIEYLAPNVALRDFFAPTGNGGLGTLSSGGVVVDGSALFDNLESEAIDEDIMVVTPTYHTQPTPDPITAVPLFFGDLFSQADVLLRAIANTFVDEMLQATKLNIPTFGDAAPPPAPPISVPTITMIFL